MPAANDATWSAQVAHHDAPRIGQRAGAARPKMANEYPRVERRHSFDCLLANARAERRGQGRARWSMIASIAGNDAPHIGEYAATHGRSAMELATSTPGSPTAYATGVFAPAFLLHCAIRATD